MDKEEKIEFYDLMQYYRHLPITEQKKVVKAFKNIKIYIRKYYVKRCKKF